MVPFAAMVVTVVYLAARGAGMFSGATYASSAFLSLVLLALAANPSVRQRFVLPSVFFSCSLLGWLLLTTIALPPSLDFCIGAARGQENQTARSMLADAYSLNLISEPISSFALTRNKAGSIRWILSFITVLAMVGLASSLRTAWKYRYLRFLIYCTTVIACLGILGQYFIPQYGRIWWRYPVFEGEPVACFVNRSHYGGFVVLACPAAILFIAGDFARRQWALAILGSVCFAIMSVAVVVSMSRGAFATYFVSLYAVIIASIRGRAHRRPGLVICTVALCSLIGVGLFVHGDVEDRLRTLGQPDAMSSAQARVSVWEDSIRAWMDYPVAGAGADGFRMIFSWYKTWDIDRSFLHAESEYLQLLVDGGVIGVVLIGGWLIAYILRLYHIARTNKNRREFVVCAACAVICALIHAAADVAFSIPLYSAVLGSIAGLPLGVSRTPADQSNDHSENTDPRHGDRDGLLANTRYRGNERTILYFGLFCLLVTALFYRQYGVQIYRTDKSWYIQSANPDELSQALRFAPTYWHAWYHLGRYALVVPDKAGYGFAERCLSVAADYNPSDPRVWESLYTIRRRLHDYAGATAAYRRMILQLSPTEARPFIAKLRRLNSPNVISIRKPNS